MNLAVDHLDDFLAGAGAGTRLGESLETIGLLLALPSILVALGLIVFLRFVHEQGSSQERVVLLSAVGLCGVLAVVGGIVEVVGAVRIGRGTWFTDLTDPTPSPLFRVLAGVLVTAGFLRVRADLQDRWQPSPKQAFGVLGAFVGAFSFAVDGHTISQGNVALNAILDVIHVVAAAIWVGGLVGLLIGSLRRRRHIETSSFAPTVIRFSTVATLAIVSVAAAGMGMSFLIVDSLNDYFMTAWGRLLLLKVGLVLGAGSLGVYNHYVIVPALESDPTDASTMSRAKATIGVEAGLLVAVMLLTVFLTGASIDH